MVEYREYTSHGPHFWLVSYLITGNQVWLQYLPNGPYQRTDYEV